MRFVKVHGAGNDFVLLPDLDDVISLTPGLVRALCAPHLGLGANGVIRLAPPRGGVAAAAFMDYWNADGSVAEMCGNGVRCVAKYLADRDLVGRDEMLIDTRGGVKAVTCRRGPDGKVVTATVDMGPPAPGKVAWALDVDGQTLEVTTLSMGNPHAVLVVDDVDDAPVTTIGPRVEHHPAFPDGTNVEFITATGPTRVRGRIWERGVGETLASGTGVAAMAAAAHLLGLTDRSVTVTVPGGRLEVEWADETLYVTGPAVEVASGVIDSDWLAGVPS